ncbi:protein kinase inhibitor [Aureococcus anophagefferens]|uniref:Protein kinase inhibitor n=1 Tax=Aureococcus anophagefferens TaxID=44056 RepID=A0ABR1FWA2_AURAN
MRREERAQRAKRFHFVGRERIFFMRARDAFLQTPVFLNTSATTWSASRSATRRLHAPVLFKERDLVAAATAYEARAKNKANLRLVPAEPAPRGGVREPAALPPFARHYLFKCGRLTMRGRGDDAGADVSILGLGAKRDAAYDPRAADAALPPPQATAPRGSAKGAKVAATHSRVL